MKSISILFTLFCFIVTALAASSKIYGEHRLITYVVDWEIPKTIKWGQIDHIAYAFAEPDANGKLKSYTESNLKSVVTNAHKNKVGVSISVGGWSGSKHFSTIVASSSKRTALVNNIVNMVKKFSLDGVNLDWEYPNDVNGVSCNAKNPKDTENYLVFVQALRKKLDSTFPKVHKLITLAVGTNTFNDKNRNPIKSLDKNWAKNVDSFYIMTYDISGSWGTIAGPNAPLKSSSKYDSSVTDSINGWKKAGIPASKIVVGVPFYGVALKTKTAITSSTGPYVKLAKDSAIKGDKFDEKSKDDCKGAIASYSGGYQWRSIVADKITSNKNGWKSFWDNVSYTPYAFKSSAKKFLSYDNAKSLKAKVDFVNKNKLGGVMVWSLEMDDSSHTLLSALQNVRN